MSEQNAQLANLMRQWEGTKREDDEKTIVYLTRECPDLRPEMRRRCRMVRRNRILHKLSEK